MLTRIAQHLRAEAASRRVRDHVQLVPLQAEDAREQEVVVRQGDRVRVDREDARRGVVVGERRDCLERLAARAAPVEAVLDHVVGLAERALDIAERKGRVQRDVGAERLVDEGGARRDRLLDRRDRVEQLEVDLDEIARVLGHVAAGCDDRGQRLSDEPRLVPRQRAEHVLVGVRAEVRERAEELERLLPGDDRDDARQFPRLARVDRRDSRVGHGTAQDRRVKHASEHHVVHVLTPTEQQPTVLDLRDRLADPGVLERRRGLGFRGHDVPPPVRSRSAVSRTASTMVW